MKYKLKIIDIVEESQGTKSYYFEKPEGFTWEAGANIHVGLVGFDEGEKPNKELVRHMSIITLPGENKIGITTRVPGSSSEFKAKLSKLKIGDDLVIFKLGTRMVLRRTGRPIFLISMGVGISAMRSFILSYIKNREGIPSITNINMDSSGFIYKMKLDKLIDNSYKNYWINSRKAFYEVLEDKASVEEGIYYVVGSDDFITEVMDVLKEHKINRDNILVDKKQEDIDRFWGF